MNALSVWGGDDALRRETEYLGAENVKRMDVHAEPSPRWLYGDAAQSPRRIAAFMETETVWHPAGV